MRVHDPGDDAMKSEPPATPYYAPELTLLDLWGTVVRRRRLVAITTMAVVTLAVAASLLLPKRYAAEAHFLSPTPGEVPTVSLSDNGVLLYQAQPGDLYRAFRLNLQSLTVQRSLFDEEGLAQVLAPKAQRPEDRDKAFEERFHDGLSIVDGQEGLSSVILESAAPPHLVAQWLNSLVSRAASATLVEVEAAARQAIDNRIETLESLVVSAREIAERQRQDAIVQLQEAATIARRLGITEREVPAVAGEGEAWLSVQASQSPLYMRGSRALDLEIRALAERKGNDAFTANLRSLEDRLGQLRSLTIDTNELAPVRLDQPARTPQQPVSPGLLVILAVALVAGFSLGSVIAGFLHWNESRA